MSSSALPWYVKLVLRVAIPAACLAALYLSIPGEIAMARTAGWSAHYAPAMPICVSVYALAAAAIAAYRRKAQLPGQVTALIGAVVALALAICAQSISHLIQQSYMGSSALLVVAVSSVPPLVIAHMMHMAETPSQVMTASEEKAELRQMIDYLSEELTTSISHEVTGLLGKGQAIVRQHGVLAEVAENAAADFDGTIAEVEAGLAEGPRQKSPRAAVGLDEVKAAGRALKARGEKITGRNLAEALGIAESTAYRYRQAALSA
ncbi:hypothetical protein [Streptomyces sp. NPDC005262]|uniref:hypothetical protein n=1 Tax=Streptomyces sp. NPDC005262 TaxID=3364710 RepID=UPI00369EB9A0